MFNSPVKVLGLNPISQGSEFDSPAGEYQIPPVTLSTLERQFSDGTMAFTQPSRGLKDLERNFNKSLYDVHARFLPKIKEYNESILVLEPSCDNDEERLNEQS